MALATPLTPQGHTWGPCKPTEIRAGVLFDTVATDQSPIAMQCASLGHHCGGQATFQCPTHTKAPLGHHLKCEGADNTQPTYTKRQCGNTYSKNPEGHPLKHRAAAQPSRAGGTPSMAQHR
jgi:hypothetical protein